MFLLLNLGSVYGVFVVELTNWWLIWVNWIGKNSMSLKITYLFLTKCFCVLILEYLCFYYLSKFHPCVCNMKEVKFSYTHFIFRGICIILDFIFFSS